MSRHVYFFFFFSSRRRHTRFSRDWNSDVCSSDLAFAQLPSDHEWCVGFHWSNGAPREMVRDALSQCEPPENLVGVVFTGSVAIPGSMENFITFIPPPFGTDRGREEWTSGNQSVDYAKTIFTRVEESAGIRTTLISVPSQGRM